MLRILQVILALVTLAFLIFDVFTGNFDFQPLIIFFLGLTSLIMGIREIQQKRKIYFVAVVFTPEKGIGEFIYYVIFMFPVVLIYLSPSIIISYSVDFINKYFIKPISLFQC